MNVFIFLDVDGVLNSFEHPGMVRLSYGLDKSHLDNFFVLRDAFDAKIVLSSCWRVSPDGIKQLKDAGVEILDTTPILWQNRALEIKVWKEKNMKPEDWGIVLDDEHVFSEPQEHLVEFKTTTEKGLLLEDVKRFINSTKIVIDGSK